MINCFCFKKLTYCFALGIDCVCLLLMDHYATTQTFELGKFISAVGKSTLNYVKLGRLVTKYSKMWKT